MVIYFYTIYKGAKKEDEESSLEAVFQREENLAVYLFKEYDRKKCSSKCQCNI